MGYVKSMKTAVAKISEATDAIIDFSHEYFAQSTRMVSDPMNHPGDTAVVLGMGDYKWRLKEGGEIGLADLLHQLEVLERQIIAVDNSERSQSAMLEWLRESRTYLRPDARHFHGAINAHQDGFAHQMDKICEHAKKLIDHRTGDVLLVTDTNSLLWNTDLESWQFEGIEKFTIVLVPQVIRELDDLKNRIGGNVELRSKAETLIRKIKEYRRRGNITEGVKLVTNKISILATAIEPDFANNLPWLRQSNPDDHIMACAVEVTRAHPRCAVGIITRDLNLQTKADLAQIECLDVPDPAPKGVA